MTKLRLRRALDVAVVVAFAEINRDLTALRLARRLGRRRSSSEVETSRVVQVRIGGVPSDRE